MKMTDDNVHFLVVLRDVPNSGDLRAKFGAAHREYAGTIEDMIVMAGPTFAENGDVDGSAFVVNMATRADIDEFLRNDPFVLNGIYDSYDIHTFKNTWA